MHYNLYATDYGVVRVSDTEGALLMAGDWIEQRPGTADHLSHIMPKVRSLREACRAVAKDRWERSRPKPYFWLGAEADTKNFQDFK